MIYEIEVISTDRHPFNCTLAKSQNMIIVVREENRVLLVDLVQAQHNYQQLLKQSLQEQKVSSSLDHMELVRGHVPRNQLYFNRE